MRKVICLVVAVLLCVGMAVSVFASDNKFVPSISYKPGPDMKEIGSYGEEALPGAEGEETLANCVVVTSIEEAEKKTTDITQEERDLLLDVYKKLDSSEMTLPLDYDYVIRDLVDLSFKYEACRMQESHNHKDQALKEEGVTLTVLFDLGVAKDQQVDVLTYIDGEWAPIEEVVNNGDGTLTCTFEDICPVAFAVK